MIPAYAASGQAWNSRGPLHHFVRPQDPANPNNIPATVATPSSAQLQQMRSTNKLILSVHRYEPVEYAVQAEQTTWRRNESDGAFNHSGTRDMVVEAMNIIQQRSNAANIHLPVILGEWGVTRQSGDTNFQRRVQYCEHFIREATVRGFRAVWWDNGANSSGRENFGLFNRSNGNLLDPSYQQIIDAIKRGRGIS
jgi:hypothetical protein